MKSVPKQLVIDKDIFQGTDQAALCKFASNHFLILPEVLLYECVTDNNDPHRELLRRFRETMLAGAHTCPSSWYIIKKEAHTLQPYSSLADPNETLRICNEFKKYSGVSISDGVAHIYEEAIDSAKKTS
ncbi:MAG: hypothetical protein ACYS80_03590 [Planctomycetota bacterium]|jgi:hypothetical protein